MKNFAKQLDTLCFYRDSLKDPVLNTFKTLITTPKADTYYDLKAKLTGYAQSIKNPAAPSAWQHYVISLLLASNSTTRALETDTFLYKHALLAELELFRALYRFDFSGLCTAFGDTENLFTKPVFNAYSALSEALFAESGAVFDALTQEIRRRGLGIFAESKIFRALPRAPYLFPVERGPVRAMDQLVGYERQKARLIQNVRAFTEGRGGLNTLLYGDMGTGKSSMVKALTLLFEHTPLRFIELKKSEAALLPDITRSVRKTPYPFIVFMDDLSFEDGDPAYTALKNALEGSFEAPPKNMLIIATSNKRTLMTQNKSERDNAVNAREVVEEKSSLVSRFGLTLSFTAPNQDDYLEIVRALAIEQGMELDEAMREQAIQWELRHMNRSGRTAEQFIQYLLTV